MTVKTAPDVTPRFVQHVRATLKTPFSVTYNAGQEGDFRFDSCELICESDAVVTSFHVE